jgi:predicted MPP superfamily phosphohydrolase
MHPPEWWGNSVQTYVFGFIFIAYASKLIPILFLLFADFIRGVSYVNHKAAQAKTSGNISPAEKKINRSQFLQKAGLISGGILFGGLFTGMLKWVYDFKIRREVVSLPNLPGAFQGWKIVQISDIHLGSWANKYPLEEAVERINELKPDLIFFTGDLVNYKTGEALRFEDTLAKLKSRHGIFATLGNHDYGDYTRWPSKAAKQQNMTDLYHFYDRLNWKLMNNENHLFESNGGNLAVIGVENWGVHGRFPKHGNINRALEGAQDASVKLLLSHDPTHWETIISKDYQDIDLTFAGHTHGFQFGIDVGKLKWSPAQWVYKHWAGMYKNPLATQKPQRLYVNRGLGTIGYPGRIGILPEITLFELQA